MTDEIKEKRYLEPEDPETIKLLPPVEESEDEEVEQQKTKDQPPKVISSMESVVIKTNAYEITLCSAVIPVDGLCSYAKWCKENILNDKPKKKNSSYYG